MIMIIGINHSSVCSEGCELRTISSHWLIHNKVPFLRQQCGELETELLLY